MKSKEEIVNTVEYIFENTKRIHGNSEALNWQKIAIYKSVSYILSELADLNAQLKQAEAEPVKNLASGQAWICPRCQKVHSWLSMTCDCEPKTITRTTYDPSDFPCIH